jgi:Ca2+-binding RTX toxin-like protein
MNGGAGHDYVDGGSGDDILMGDDPAGTGGHHGPSMFFKDSLVGGNDVLLGGSGNDKMYGMAGMDSLYGQDGNDMMQGGRGNDYLNGGTGNDELYGMSDNDTLDGGAGMDTLDGGSGDDFLYGDADNDTLIGQLGNDRLDGGDGIDVLNGGDGVDVLLGGAGHDFLAGGLGADTHTGGTGADTFQFLASDLVTYSHPYLYGRTYQSVETDRVTDFNAAEGDRIDLTSLMSKATNFQGTTAAQAMSQGYLYFVQQGANTLVMLDRNGAGADMAGIGDIRVAELSNVNASTLVPESFLVGPGTLPTSTGGLDSALQLQLYYF